MLAAPAMHTPHDPPSRGDGDGRKTALFAATIGVGAFLLFQVQFILGKQILPWFGGAPAVWTTCMLFFQVALLLGYAYAHGLARVDAAPRQRAIHLSALALALALLLARALLWPSPITPSDAWKPVSEDSPILAITSLLLFTVGLPFLVLAATGPLLQAWFARVLPQASPYRLYALSNLGSLLGLVTYPFLVETALAVPGQGWLWSGGFAVYAVLCAIAAVIAGRAPTARMSAARATDAATAAGPGPRDFALWFTLAAIPSTMLLAVTNQISLEVAVIPFLWMLPLALYLISFILCFERERLYHRGVFGPLMLAGAGGITATLLVGVHAPIAVQLAVDLVGLFAYCMVCHGELVRVKPPPRHLTAFYLTISAGGAFGGIFTGVVAPTLFKGLWELPIALFVGVVVAIAVIGRDRETWIRRRRRSIQLVVAALLTALVAGLLGALAYHIRDEQAGNLLADRSFFGTLRIDVDSTKSTGDYLRLRHGRIIHGVQFVDDELRRTPNSYYGPASGVGLAVVHRRTASAGAPIHLGVIGLGTGTIATWGASGDRLRFYEIDREVLALSRGDDPWFTYLQDTPAAVSTVIGDARLTLEREEPQGFDVLVVDAFSSDSIPAHLITVEAIELYLRHLAPDGIIALHISNRYLDLDPLARGLAGRLGLHIVHVGESTDDPVAWTCDWMLLSRDPTILDDDSPIAAKTEAADAHDGPYPVWTDARSNLLEVLRR